MGEQGLLHQLTKKLAEPALEAEMEHYLSYAQLENPDVFQHANEIETRTDTLFLTVDFESVNCSLPINCQGL